MNGEDGTASEKFSLEQLSDAVLLKLILEEVRGARQDCFCAARTGQDKKKCGYYTKLARYIDTVFLVTYIITIVAFLAYIYNLWVKQWWSNAVMV